MGKDEKDSATAIKSKRILSSFVGILEIIAGILLVFISLIIGITIGGSDLGLRIGAFLFYLFLAAFFIIMGIGTIRLKKWARLLMHTASVLWLAFGCIIIIFIILFSSFSKVFAGFSYVGYYVLYLFASIFFLVLPLLLLLYYSSRKTIRTFQLADVKQNWTNNFPFSSCLLIAVLGFSILRLILGAVFFLPLTLYGMHFGKLLSFILQLMAAVFLTFSLFYFLKKKVLGWWSAVVIEGILLFSLLFDIISGNLLNSILRYFSNNNSIDLTFIESLYGGLLPLSWFIPLMGFYIYIFARAKKNLKT